MKHCYGIMAAMLFAASAHALEPTPAASPPSAPSPAPATSARPAAAPAAAPDTDLQPAVTTTDAAATRPGSAAPARRAQDRIELDTTQITGNRELPRVLYVVPWKRPDLGDLAGRPANSLLDEVLSPVDRDVFRRQNRYYQALKPDSNAGSVADAAEGEK